ncbi:MAG: FadR family transcriptional regulator [Spirochaetaceae bacterium]
MAKQDLVKETVTEIEGWIRDGKYSNMDLLPSELEISKQLDVSRATVRDAIRILEVRGFVQRLHGVGVKVNNKSTEVAINFLAEMLERNNITYNELLEIRILMEPKASSLAALNGSNEDKEVLKSCIETMEKETVTSRKFQESDYLFHSTIAKASGNRLLHTIVESYSPILLKQIAEADKKEFLEESQLHYHRNIYECIVNSDSEGAKETMMIHLNATKKNLN